MISRNINKIGESDDFISYRAQCACLDENHRHDIIIEVDDFGEINIRIFTNLEFYDDEKNWFLKIWKRIKLAFRVIFIGYGYLNSTLLFDNNEQISDYIKALNEGMKKMEEYKKNKEIEK